MYAVDFKGLRRARRPPAKPVGCLCKSLSAISRKQCLSILPLGTPSHRRVVAGYLNHQPSTDLVQVPSPRSYLLVLLPTLYGSPEFRNLRSLPPRSPHHPRPIPVLWGYDSVLRICLKNGTKPASGESSLQFQGGVSQFICLTIGTSLR